MVLRVTESFEHIHRIHNTNVRGSRNVCYALTAIKGVGIRYSTYICKKANIDINKRAGELSEDEVRRVEKMLDHPLDHGVPDWFLNRQRDVVTGKTSQLVSGSVDNAVREDIDRMKKMLCHRGLRHTWRLRVRGQRTKTTGRRGKTVGVSKKKN